MTIHNIKTVELVRYTLKCGHVLLLCLDLTSWIEPFFDHRIDLDKEGRAVDNEEPSKPLRICLLIHVRQ